MVDLLIGSAGCRAHYVDSLGVTVPGPPTLRLRARLFLREGTTRASDRMLNQTEERLGTPPEGVMLVLRPRPLIKHDSDVPNLSPRAGRAELHGGRALEVAKVVPPKNRPQAGRPPPSPSPCRRTAGGRTASPTASQAARVSTRRPQGRRPSSISCRHHRRRRSGHTPSAQGRGGVATSLRWPLPCCGVALAPRGAPANRT